MIFNQHINQGIVPDEMKTAKVRPLNINGTYNGVNNNYRPISLLSVLSKVLEKIVYARMINLKNNVLNISQYGLRKEHSTSHAIAECVGDILNGFNFNYYTLAFYIDPKKHLAV